MLRGPGPSEIKVPLFYDEPPHTMIGPTQKLRFEFSFREKLVSKKINKTAW